MLHQYKMAIFDVDGTLLNTAEGVLSAVKYTIKKHNLLQISEEQLKSFIGPPIQNSFSKVYGINEKDYLQVLARTFRDRYKDFDLLKASPYDGIYEVCEKLLQRGIKIAVATYKREDYALKIMEHFGFDRYTDIIYGADHENKLKKQDIIERCLHAGGLFSKDEYDAAVMIGDSDNDAIGAENIGINFIGVTYGFGFNTSDDVMKFRAQGVANTTLEILNYLL